MGAAARIAVFPALALRERARLFAALEAAYPVSFRAYDEADPHVCQALIALAGEPPPGAPAALPRLIAPAPERPRKGRPARLALQRHAAQAEPLRGASLSERWCDSPADLASGAPPNGSAIGSRTVLATLDGAPAWVVADGITGGGEAAPSVPKGPDGALAGPSGAHTTWVAAAPAELTAGESLRERLSPGRCLALMALVQFLRGVCGQALAPASPGAAFVLDDPNLHWPTYGRVRYRELAAHAERHGYHMVIAMPPLDGWYAHPRAVRVFAENPGALSVCVHGNDHQGPELGRLSCDEQATRLARQALARAIAFERRTGVPVDPVMVPPHEQLSEHAARGLLAAGFRGVCVSRPYPWIAPRDPSPPAALGAGPPERGALAGWDPFEKIAGGLPVLLRTGFDAPREDLALRAFLGQPLILYGHHDLLRDGLDVLTEAARAIDALGRPRWGSLAQIAGGLGCDADRSVEPAVFLARPAEARAAGIPSGEAHPPLRPRLRPLVRRLASEARDRVL